MGYTENPFYPGDEYHSGEHRVSLLARLLPSWVFYAKMISLYYHAGKKAAKPGYSGRDWTDDSLTCINSMHSIGGHFHIEGMDNLKNLDGPCVFASNHMSTLETIALPSIIEPVKDCTFVIKAGLLNYPYFRNLLIARECIVVQRKNPKDDLRIMLNEGCANLSRGRSIIVFPQGTRHRTFDPAQFNSIAVKLAAKAGVPVVPLALQTNAWGEGRILHDFGLIKPSIPIHFRFGAPIQVSGNGKEAQAAVISFIQSTLRSWDPANVKTDSAS